MLGQNQPWPEMPKDWHICREEFYNTKGFNTVYYGLNKVTGQETVRFTSYEKALQAAAEQNFLKS